MDDELKEYEVTLPIAGHAYLTVRAASEEEAIEMAMNECTISEVEEWEPLKRFNQGNFCYCPHPWEAEAQCTDDD